MNKFNLIWNWFKRNKTKLLILYIFLIYFGSLTFGIIKYARTDICEESNNIMVRNPLNKTVSVLHWETGRHWAGWGGDDDSKYVHWAGYNVVKNKCDIKCEFHGEQSRWNTSDVVLFEPQPFGDRGEEFPPNKLCGQKYVMFSYETPLYFPLQSSSLYLSQMDWKMTYEEDSDVRVSFICPWGYDEGIEAYRRPIQVPFKEKTGFAVFVASNCDQGGANFRTEYVRELMQYIQVDSYGLCLQNQPEDALNRNTARERFTEKMDKFSKYKFVLAFENSNYTDYVTEKIAHAILSTSLPVYMGTNSIDEWIPNEKSIIKTSDFESPKDLANYLLNLAENEEEYMSYFYWKKLLFQKSFVDRYNDCLFNAAECALCKRVVSERLSAHTNPKDYLYKYQSDTILGSGIKLDYKFYKLQKITLAIIVTFIVIYLIASYSFYLIPIIVKKIDSMLRRHNY